MAFPFEKLNRASTSIAANIAEGNGRFTKADRTHFFGILLHSQGSLHDDFSIFSTDRDGRQQVNEAEMRLLYVALTRAQRSVGLPSALTV